jgi:hypothetical protein
MQRRRFLMPRSKNVRRGERTPRSFWFDPRFGIGVGLVLVSILGVLWIVATADRTVSVYSAQSELSPGQRIHASDLVVESVRLGGAGDKYLTRADVPDAGLLVTRSVAAGELVPVSAVGTGGADVASVVVSVNGQLPQSVQPGTVVDLWSAREVEQGAFGPPSVLVASATVVRLIEPDGFVAGDARSVELLVSRSKTAGVLEAVANQDAMSLVPVALPVRG